MRTVCIQHNSAYRFASAEQGFLRGLNILRNAFSKCADQVKCTLSNSSFTFAAFKMILEIIYAGGIGLLIYIFVNYLIQLSELKKYPPGPIPLPIIGNIHLLGRKPHESLVQLSKKYGPVMSLTFGTQRIVVINAIEQAREALLKKGEEFAGRPQDIHAASIVTHEYNDIAFADYGNAWKMMRKVAHGSLKMYGAGMEDLEGKIQLEIQELFTRFDGKSGTPFNPHHDLGRYQGTFS